jgi:hypothetical protein
MALISQKNRHFSGLGIGMGTNIGAKRLSGALDFLIAETEWGLIMGELGFF